MSQTKQVADRFREVMLNGKWIANTNFKAQISNLSWTEAITQHRSLNTIALLTFHINYYIKGLVEFFDKGELTISDKYSFDAPPIQSQEDWDSLKSELFSNSEKFANIVESWPDEKLDEIFVDKKYGTYLRNIEGMIEHSYYHLGQVSLIKKMIQ